MALEIRIHGVANTSPLSMLQEYDTPVAQVELADGDATSGFWRRSDELPNAQLRRLAYSWGRLTAGRPTGKDVARGAWAALLPFALANAALWAVEPDPVETPKLPKTAAEPVVTKTLRHYVVRVLCLLLTGTFALAITGVVVDQGVWQCQYGGCDHKFPGQDEVIAGWLAGGLRPLGVGLTVVALAMVAIFWIAHRSYKYEAYTAHLDAIVPARAHPFASTMFWQGKGQVSALARLHLAVGFAVPSAVVAGAVRARLDQPGSVRAGEVLAWIALGFAAAAALVVVYALATAPITTRTDATPPPWTWAPLGLAVVGFGMTIAAVVPSVDEVVIFGPHRAALPGYSGAVAGSFTAQIVLLFVLGAASARMVPRVLIALLVPAGTALLIARHLDESDSTALSWGATVALALAAVALLVGGASPTAAWRGQAPTLFCGAGVIVASLYSAAALFWVANWLNGHPPVTDPASTVQVPVALLWSGAGLLIAMPLFLVVGAVGWLRYRAHTRTDTGPVQTEYPQADMPTAQYKARVKQVATARALHDLIGGDAFTLVGAIGAIAFVMCTEGALVTLLGYSPIGPDGVFPPSSNLGRLLNWATNTGCTLTGFLAVGLALTLLLAYRDAGPMRKMFGVLWDIATFWPRAAHPFMPPCYAERIVPQLLDKINSQEADEQIVCSAHSQGSVIGTAMLMQLPTSRLERTYYLTYGTQLTRLFGRIFPRYLGRNAKDQLAALLDEAAPRWTSLWRRTDFLGWQLDVTKVANNEVRDPPLLGPLPHDVSPQPIHKHSDYWLTAEYVDARDAALQRLP